MYSTKNEFSVLCGLKFGLSNAQIKKKFNLKESDINKNKINLCRKYGCSVLGCDVLNKADFTKLEVFEENKIPYLEYENSLLVKKIKIKKADIKELSKFLKACLRIKNMNLFLMKITADFIEISA